MASRFDFVPCSFTRSECAPVGTSLRYRNAGPLLVVMTHVRVAVAVEVAERGAAADLRLREPAADGIGDVREPALALIVEQVRRLGVA